MKWQSLVWYDPPVTEDDYVSVEEYYHLMARVLALMS